jgi:hypothetical protein
MIETSRVSIRRREWHSLPREGENKLLTMLPAFVSTILQFLVLRVIQGCRCCSWWGQACRAT